MRARGLSLSLDSLAYMHVRSACTSARRTIEEDDHRSEKLRLRSSDRTNDPFAAELVYRNVLIIDAVGITFLLHRSPHRLFPMPVASSHSAPLTRTSLNAEAFQTEKPPLLRCY